MKKTRKFAALLAALMCVSGMGAMNAFAGNYTIDDDNNTNDGSSVTNVTDNDAVYANLRVGTNITRADTYQATPTWDVEVSTTDLTWTVTATRTYLTTLTWDSEHGAYSVGSTDAGTMGTVTVTGGNKTVSILNRSNFSVTPAVTIVGTEDDTASSLFTASDTSAIESLGNLNVTISPDDRAFQSAFSDFTVDSSGISVMARAKFTFARTNGSTLTQYNENNVTDSSAG